MKKIITLLLTVVLVAGGLSSFAYAQVGVTNLGLATWLGQVEENLVAFVVSEAAQDNTDLNGDGDALDGVLHLYDATTGTTTNLGLPSFYRQVQVAENLVAFVVYEGFQGNTDLNGDGDALDSVLHVYDRATGTTTNLGLDTYFDTPPQVAGNLVAFRVREFAQGGNDLNGDGDAFDNVAHVYDATTGITTNLSLHSPRTPQVAGNLVAFIVGEASQGGTDLNGDGDTVDGVAHVYDAATGITTNLGLECLINPQVAGNLVAFCVREFPQGGNDLNGDGDALDSVLHVYDRATGITTNLALSTSEPQVSGNLLAFAVVEGGQGSTDLNGDGDALDRVVHVYDAATGITTNVGLDFIGFVIEMEGSLAYFVVREASQGGTDLNGDGDALDYVLHIYDAATDTTTNLGLACYGGTPPVAGSLVAFVVNEASQGGTDLNGDGDALDYVVHINDATTGTTTNLGLASSGSLVTPTLATIHVIEAWQGGIDLNGDGDALDYVAHVYDATTGITTNLGLATGTIQVDGDLVAIAVSEASQGSTDLNGDGDTNDYVLHVTKLVTVDERLADIRAEILDFYNSGDIFGPGDSGEGYQNSLLAKVDAAIAAWNEGDPTTMKNNLNALVNKINSPGALNHISGEARDALMAKVEAINAAL